jgi:hypothetical protein
MRASELDNGKLRLELDPNNLDQEKLAFKIWYPKFLATRRQLGFPEVDQQTASDDQVGFGEMIGAKRAEKLIHDRSTRSGSDGNKAAIENQKAALEAKQLTACLIFCSYVASNEKMDFGAFAKDAANNKNATEAWKGILIPGFEAFAHVYSQGGTAALLEYLSPLTNKMTKSEAEARLERLTRKGTSGKKSDIRHVREILSAFAAREVLSSQSPHVVLDLVCHGLQGFMDWVDNQNNDYSSEFTRLKYVEVMLRRLKLVRLTPSI